MKASDRSFVGSDVVKVRSLTLRRSSAVRAGTLRLGHGCSGNAQNTLAALKKQVSALKASTPKIDVARFKDLTGVSRKYAIPLLEYLDRERVTRRVGDAREIL